MTFLFCCRYKHGRSLVLPPSGLNFVPSLRTANRRRCRSLVIPMENHVRFVSNIFGEQKIQSSDSGRVNDGKFIPNSMNFDRSVMQNAFHGEFFMKHSSNVRMLSTLRTKVPLIHRCADPVGTNIGKYNTIEFKLTKIGRGKTSRSMKGISAKNGLVSKDKRSFSVAPKVSNKEIAEKKMVYFAPELIDDDKYFWREEEHEEYNFDNDGIDFNKPFEAEYGKKDFEFRPVNVYDKIMGNASEDDSDIEEEDDSDEEGYSDEMFDLDAEMDSDEDEDSDKDEDSDDDEDSDEFEVSDDEEYSDEEEDNDKVEARDNEVGINEEEDSDEELDRGKDDEDFNEKEIPVIRKRKEAWETKNPDEFFFYGQNDIFQLMKEDASLLANEGNEDYKMLDIPAPLNEGGGVDFEDFLQAMQEHPTNYAQVERTTPHVESQREPIPHYSRNREQPSIDFLNSHSRFLYVSGLPPLYVNGEVADITNQWHRSLVEREIARLVGKDISSVYAASTTSGYVGFDSPKKLASALRKGPTHRTILLAPMLCKPVIGVEDNHFFAISPETTLLLDRIPTGNTPETMSRDLFPVGTEIGTVYGGLDPDCFHFLSETSVLVRFQTAAQADSALNSKIVQDRLKEFGQYHVRYFRARRNLVHDGFTGPNKAYEKRKMGAKLIVDGDMPSKKFFLSHAGTLKLYNLDPALSIEDITLAFQPYSTLLRDIYGSVEFVTCEFGMKTGEAFVGFDIFGDCEAALEKIGSKMKLGDRICHLKLVRNRNVPGRPVRRPMRRPDRPVNELLSDLTLWEKYVDPADIAELEKAGINKVILDDALRVIRYNNPTFGPLDSALRSEALHPEKEPGQHYKEIVQLYIKTLKECIATPEDVGFLWEAQHYRDQPIDLSIFDEHKERQKKRNK